MGYSWVNESVSSRTFGKKLRLNPCHLPQSLSYKGQASAAYFSARLTERGIFIEEGAAARPAPSAAALPPLSAMAAPVPARQRQQATGALFKIFSPRQFRGIAACKISLGAAPHSAKAFCLQLLHENADYCVPLLISACKDDVLLDWRLWADIYNLPMLTEEKGGNFLPLTNDAALKLFINDRSMRFAPREFSLRCHGLSLNTRLVLANQVMLG